MRIESIKPGKRDKEKLVIRLENGEYVSAYIDEGYKLRVGDDLSEAEIEKLNSGFDAYSARKSAARSLAKRNMSKFELEKKLRDRGYSESDSETAVQWFEERGFIDDEAYARMCVEYYKGRGYGALRIREELRRRGIDKEISEELIGNFETDEDGIKNLIVKKLNGREMDSENKRKIVAFLLRRGFKFDEIRAAMADLRLDTEDLADG